MLGLGSKSSHPMKVKCIIIMAVLLQLVCYSALLLKLLLLEDMHFASKVELKKTILRDAPQSPA
jgi:hypothetical protein